VVLLLEDEPAVVDHEAVGHAQDDAVSGDLDQRGGADGDEVVVVVEVQDVDFRDGASNRRPPDALDVVPSFDGVCRSAGRERRPQADVGRVGDLCEVRACESIEVTHYGGS
jgi:hypothetical protein